MDKSKSKKGRQYHTDLLYLIEFIMLIKTKMLKNKVFFCVQTLRGCINHAIKC